MELTYQRTKQSVNLQSKLYHNLQTEKQHHADTLQVVKEKKL